MDKSNKMTQLLPIVTVLLAITACGNNPDGPLTQPYVQGVTQGTIYGLVEGVEQDGVLSWLGIRFAKAPEGDLRWKSPQEPEAWSDVKETKSAASRCIQGANGSGEEDCLFLNIYRPDSEATYLPVYVWIHGGSNSAGGAPNLSFFAKEANVVAVSIQYRLGPLGFFKHDALATGDSLDDSGNYGLLDQLMALEWVQDNIAYFGGDPTNVTAAGESAGAHDILSMMMSSYAEGLFHKVIYQSGGMGILELPRAKEQSATYVANLGLTSAGETLSDELRALDPEAILAALPEGASFSVIVDGNLIPGSYYCLLKSGNYNHVQILMGGNRNESSLWLVLGGGPEGKWTQFRGNGRGDPPRTVDNVLSAEEQDEYAFANDLAGRSWQARRVHTIARSIGQFQDDVYVYDFRWGGTVGTDVEFVFGAAHANEITYFNYEGNSDVWAGNLSITDDNKAAREALAQAMRTYYARFLHTGDPNGGTRTDGTALPSWEPWSNTIGDVKALNLDASSVPGSADLDIFMTTREYLLAELNQEIDDVADPTFRSWLSRYQYPDPLCTNTSG
jgi:para-nitrobenzyl esterase